MMDRTEALTKALEHIKAGRFDRTAALCRPLVEHDPTDADARFFLAVSLATLGGLDEAIAHLDAVLAARPDHADARRELLRMLEALAIASVDRGDMATAILAFGRIAGIDPLNAAAHSNLGTALATEGRFDEALAAANDALRLAPADVTIHVNRAVNLLKAGRYLEGWAENEWRHKKPGRERLPPALLLPRLAHLGDLNGRTIVVYHEEGFGDTLQFLRYVPLLAERGARVIAWMPQELLALVRRQAGIAKCLTGDITLPRFDYHCPIISLPYVFGTTVETVPAKAPYVTADPDLAHRRAARFNAARLPGGPRIGLVWSGEPRAYDPTAQALDARRSIPFETLRPLIGLPGFAFVSLQMGRARSQVASPVYDPMGDVGDFADTAAIVANLDLVVSVDTSVAHLAGAMGKPVYLLDRYDNCWRWLTGRTDSPWYPMLRIFRQPRVGDWASPVADAAAALKAEFDG